MSSYKVTNISVKELRKALKNAKCNLKDDNDGHDKWIRSDLQRPLTFSNHINPVPAFIVKQIMRYLKWSPKDLHDHINK